jgi:hypothetical protein
MPWVRLDENALDHPKIGGLPDGAFRLWVQGLAYCQKFLTDGYISDLAVRGLRSFSPTRKALLVAAVLWELSETGVNVHDFLDWNESREHVLAARLFARERVRKAREKQRSNTVTHGERSPNVPSGVCVSSSVFGFPDRARVSPAETEVATRAGAFIEWYQALHIRLRKARYVGKPQFDFSEALTLVRAYDDDLLHKLAFVWLNTDHDFAQQGTRTLAKFRSMVSWCEEQLNAWEAKHGPLEVAS